MRVPTISCRLCGSIIRASDSVVEVQRSDPPIVHAGCAESAHIPPGAWEHTEPRTLTEWSRGMGWAGSAGTG